MTCRKHPGRKLEAIGDGSLEGGLQNEAIFGPARDAMGEGSDRWGYIQLPSPVKVLLRDGRLEVREQNNPSDGLEIGVIPVLPRRYRMPVRSNGLEAFGCASVLDDCYADIMSKCKLADPGIAQSVRRLFETLLKGLVDKEGLIRHDGLGRRVDRSFRLVIVPDPALAVDQCRVPADILWEVLSDAEGDDLTKYRVGWSWRVAKRDSVRGDAYKKSIEFLASYPETRIILNRQPSLHRDSILAFRPVPSEDSAAVLGVPPLSCDCFGADFDGDEMVGHAVGERAQGDLKHMTLKDIALSIDKCDLRAPTEQKSVYKVDRDFVSGLALLARKGNLPPWWGAANSDLQKVDIERRLYILCREERDADERVRKIKELARLAFAAATRNGCSFGYYDLFDGRGKRGGDLSVTLSNMVVSDANGKDQIGQYVQARGELKSGQLGFDTTRLTGPIKNFSCTLTDGMTWQEIFDSSYNARGSMCDKKLGTALSGDLTRKLVFALQYMTIGAEDCGCSGKRSVLDCTCSSGVCRKCYGALPDGELPPVGYPIGLIAALAIGECGTQLSMKSAHTSGSKNDFSAARQIIYGAKLSWKDFYDKIICVAPDYAKRVAQRHFEILWRGLKKSGREGRMFSNHRFCAFGGDSLLDRLVFARSFQDDVISNVWSGKDVRLKATDSSFASVMFGERGGL